MRNSRWTTKAITKNGQIVGTKPNTPGDVDILKWLGRYTLLTIPDLCALTKRSYQAVAARTNKLKREPNRLIKVADAQTDRAHLHQWSCQVLQLTTAGASKLAELGFEAHVPKPSQHFIHQLTAAQTAASFEVGARLTGLEIIRLERASIPVQFSFKGETERFNLTPDGGPIALGYGNDNWRFVVFETDCASEPLTSSNRDRQAIEKKFAAYLTVLTEGLYETHWKIPKLTVLFTTTTKARLQNMADLLASMKTNYINCFRFNVFPTILSGTQQPPAGWAVTQTGFSPAKEK
jgi:hypothetical protein